MSLATPTRSMSRLAKKSNRTSQIKSAAAKPKSGKRSKSSGVSKSAGKKNSTKNGATTARAKKFISAKAGKLIYFFAAKGSECSADMKTLLGGKGANLAAMC